MVKKVAFNTIAYVIGSGVAQIFALVFTLILMDRLPVAEYGNYNLVISLVAIFSFLIDGGLTGFIIKEFNNRGYDLEEPSFERDSLICSTYIYQVIVTSLLILLYTLTVLLTVNSIFIINYLAFGLLTLLLGLATPVFALLIANEKKHLIVAKDIIVALIRLILIVTIFKFSFSTQSIYFIPAGALIVAVALGVIFFKSILSGFKKFTIPRKDQFLNILKVVSPFLLLSLFNVIYNKIDILMLNELADISEVAFYAGATIFVYPFMFICAAASSAILPFFSKMAVKGDKSIRDEKLILIFMLGLGAVLSSFLYLISPYLYTSLFDGKYLASIEIYKVLVWYLLVVFGYTSLSSSLVAKGKIATLISMNLVMIILNVILNYQLIPQYGAKGAAFATVVSEVVILLFLFSYNKVLQAKHA